jgi:hypothetical protein
MGRFMPASPPFVRRWEISMSGVHAGGQVRFDFDGALDLARSLWALADHVDSSQADRTNSARVTLDHWQGRYADSFREGVNVAVSNASHLSEAFRLDARNLATLWKRAMDQENLVRYAEHVDRMRAERGIIEHVRDYLFGDDTDYGPRPSPVPVPQPPNFAATA